MLISAAVSKQSLNNFDPTTFSIFILVNNIGFSVPQMLKVSKIYRFKVYHCVINLLVRLGYINR